MMKQDRHGKPKKMPFFALIFESSLTGDEYDEMISTIEDIGSSKMEVVKEKMGKVNLSWFLHPENQEVTKFDPESTVLCRIASREILFANGR